MRQKVKDGEAKKGAPEWMVTFSDVMSLLVTFFVMLLTFSTADKEKFDKARGSLRGAFGVTMSEVSRLPESGMLTERLLISGRSSPSGMDFPPDTDPLQWAVTNINSRLKKEKYGAPLTMQLLGRGVLLRIPSSVIFTRNTAMFAPLGQDYLSRIAMAVRVRSDQIEVMCHVGSEFKGTARGSAWDLTQRRAAKVAEFLDKGWGVAPGRLVVGGMGGSRPLGRNPARNDDRIEITIPRKKAKPLGYRPRRGRA